MQASQPQSQEPASVVDRLVAVTQQQQLCSCNRKEKVMYVCVKKTCINHTKQPLYCVLCCEDDEPAHNHPPKLISTQNSSLST